MGKAGSKNHLQPEDIQDLVDKVDFNEEEIKNWYKGFLKDCPSGKLNLQTFSQVYSSLFPYGDPVPFSECVFRTFDTNKDGFVDFKEFIVAISVTSKGSAEKKLHWAFNMYDMDGNGFITEDEMLHMIRAIYKMTGSDISKMKIPSDEATPELCMYKIFKQSDLNRDGKISEEEFIIAASSHSSLMRLMKCDLF